MHIRIARLVLVTISLLLTSISHCFAGTDYKIILMLGQSNMVGSGRLGDHKLVMESNQEIIPSVKIKATVGAKVVTSNGVFYGNAESPFPKEIEWTELDKPDKHFSYYEDRIGPEYGFATHLKKLRPNTNLALLKIAFGSTSLNEDWKVDSPGYKYIKAQIEKALGELQNNQNDTYEIAGILWMQGEADATDKTASENYKKNLEDFISKLRLFLKTEATHGLRHIEKTWGEIPFITGLITTSPVGFLVECNLSHWGFNEISTLKKKKNIVQGFDLDQNGIADDGLQSSDLPMNCLSDINDPEDEDCPINTTTNNFPHPVTVWYRWDYSFNYPSKVNFEFAHTVRAAQQQITLEKYGVIDTSPLQRGCGYDAEVHLSAQGLWDMGELFANKLVQYGTLD